MTCPSFPTREWSPPRRCGSNPPAWVLVRRAVEDCPLGSFTLPSEALIMLSQWVMHHDPRY